MVLARRNGKAILPWMQCPGCEAWMKPTKKMVDFSEFGDGDTYCDNCWKYWDDYKYYYYHYYYYYYYYYYCLQVLRASCSNE